MLLTNSRIGVQDATGVKKIATAKHCPNRTPTFFRFVVIGPVSYSESIMEPNLVFRVAAMSRSGRKIARKVTFNELAFGMV